MKKVYPSKKAKRKAEFEERERKRAWFGERQLKSDSHFSDTFYAAVGDRGKEAELTALQLLMNKGG